MIQNNQVRENDVVVFKESDRKSLAFMSDREFAKEFQPYMYLLVRLQDKMVLAASVSGDCVAMLAEFRRCDKNQEVESAGRLVFWSGPQSLELIAKAGAVGSD